MAKLLIKNANIISKDAILENYGILCDSGKIIKFGKTADFRQISEVEVIDAEGKYLAPGFIDLHFHGIGNYLVDNGIDDLEHICKILPRYGVLGFLPTVAPKPKGLDIKFLAELSKVKSAGAQVLGFHLEGPFLTLTGSLPSEALGEADSERVKALIEATHPYKAIFSISPEFESITDLISLMTKNDTPVFITHTKANVRQTLQAIKAGACHATHFYDVFYPPDETDHGVRPCGAVEVILADEQVSVDFIVDCVHVDPVAVKMALKCKGLDKVCLITDANIGTGNKPGKYMFGKNEIEFKYPGSPARMTENSSSPGGLAGSGLTMNIAVKNAVEILGLDLPSAVRMASANPANVLGLKNKGRIEEGFDADWILMNEDYEIINTSVNFA